MNDTWQRVLTVNEYYDGPVFGIAGFRGVPHVYERQWDPALDEYGAFFLLSPIEPDLLDLVMEDWEIWLRWEAAFKRSEIDEKLTQRCPKSKGDIERSWSLSGIGLSQNEADRSRSSATWKSWIASFESSGQIRRCQLRLLSPTRVASAYSVNARFRTPDFPKSNP